MSYILMLTVWPLQSESQMGRVIKELGWVSNALA